MTLLKKRKRLLLKLSGEILRGDAPFGIDSTACKRTAEALKRLHTEEVDLAIVIGGGNIFRGGSLKSLGIEGTPADQIGMMATIMNGIALREALKALGCQVRVMSALDCPRLVESYQWEKANASLEAHEILIFVGGTGNPYFTTDTTAALRASEIGATLLLKATKVNGVYNKDPKKFPDATRYETLSFDAILKERLGVIDATAAALCINSGIPLFIFNMELLYTHSIEQIINDKHHGTLVVETLR